MMGGEMEILPAVPDVSRATTEHTCVQASVQPRRSHDHALYNIKDAPSPYPQQDISSWSVGEKFKQNKCADASRILRVGLKFAHLFKVKHTYIQRENRGNAQWVLGDEYQARDSRYTR